MVAVVAALTLEQQLVRLESQNAICSTGPVRTFYARRAYAPAWTDANVDALLRSVGRAADEGLDPADYTLPQIRASAGVERDIFATDVFLTYATHLMRGRVDPESLDRAWCIEPRHIDLAAVLASALTDGTVAETLARLAPRHEAYQRLRAALQVYRAMSDWAPIAAGPSLKRGRHGERVAQLRTRFGMSGGDTFDDALDVAVRDFQRHHGLAEDGIVGRNTLRELNVSRRERVQQIAINLERWRWMPEELGARHLLVNIAAFRLDLIDGGRSTLSMRIVAGKEYTETPFFSAAVERVLVNPPWNVPDSIAAKELWPKQARDPGYFGREHIRVVAGGRLRQDPGPWCALGRIKFDMPNRFNVYLHDTPAKTLFSADLRAFSHGCIRLEQPMELAIALTGRSREAIQEKIDAGREVTISLDKRVPVYVLYWTAFVADDGDIEFRRDVYRRDAALAQKLMPAVTAPRSIGSDDVQ